MQFDSFDWNYDDSDAQLVYTNIDHSQNQAAHQAVQIAHVPSKDTERKNKYLGNFQYKESPAFKLVSKMCIREDGSPLEWVKLPMLKSLITCILDVEIKSNKNAKINRCRDSKRGKAQNYKFIQDNYALFEAYYKAGTRLIVQN